MQLAGAETRQSTGRLGRAMPPNLSNLELEVLHNLVNGEAVSLSSQLRLRLEPKGVTRDRAQGIVVTADGRRLTLQKPAHVAARNTEVTRDSRGRRIASRLSENGF
jgi:hypothetical protein